MTAQSKIDITDIIKAGNLKYLDEKINKVRAKETNNDALEADVIEVLVSSLVEHGKNQNLIIQIAQISKVLAEGLGLNAKYCSLLEQAARVYDIGNTAISRKIYEKDDKLSFEEFEIVKNHTLIGYEILKVQHFESTDLGALISAQHHEWFNGGGYPAQLKEDAIDISARIVAIADSVGILFRNRPGRRAWGYDKIVDYIQVRNSLQFDPEIVKVFLSHQKVIHDILQTNFVVKRR